MLGKSPEARSELAAAGGGKMKKEADPTEVMRQIWTPGRVSSHILAVVTNGGSLRSRLDEARLATSVMANPYLGRLFAMQFFYMMSVTQLWKEQKLNVVAHKDDWPDITNVLYAGNGDIILTADGWLRRATAVVEQAIGAATPASCLTVRELLSK
jgi:hypothetical protein